MAKFCGRCGSRLDETTGLCPNCAFGKDNGAPKRVRIASTDYNNSRQEDPLKKKTLRRIKKQQKKADKKAARKEKKRVKRAAMSTGQKVGRFFLKLLAIVLVLSILATGAAGLLVYFGFLDIPVISNILDDIGIGKNDTNYEKEIEKNLPETDMSGFSYYNSSSENFDADGGVSFVNNELVVYLKSKKYKPDLEKYLLTCGGTIVGGIPELARYQILFDTEKTYDEIMVLKTELERNSFIVSVSLNYVFPLTADSSDSVSEGEYYYPNDAVWESMWGDVPDGANWGMEAIEAPDAWNYRDCFSEVNIGIFDDMFYTNHPDLNFVEEPLANKKALGEVANGNLQWSDHGTHVSGTAGATFDNAKGVSGVAIKTNLYGAAVKGMAETTNSYATALYYLIVTKKCSVVNISLGGDVLTFNASRGNAYAKKQLNAFQEEIASFLELLIDKNYQFIICKAAGNQNDTDFKKNKKYVYYLKDTYDDESEYMYYSYSDYESYINGTLKGGNADEIKKYFARHKNDLETRVDDGGCLDCGNVDVKFDILGAITNTKVQKRIIIVGAAKNLGSHKEGGFLWWGRTTVHDGFAVADFSQCGSIVSVIAPGVGIQSTVKTGLYSVPDPQKWQGTSMASPHVAGVAGLVFSAVPNICADRVKEIICKSATGSYGADGYGLVNAKKAVEMALKINAQKLPENKTEEPSSAPKSSSDFYASAAERDIVLVLDVSGSMDGTPLDETKKASENFISTVLKETANIGVVTYDDDSYQICGFSSNERQLKDVVSTIDSGGGTNIEAGLSMADDMLRKSNAEKKVIVLMSDGEPNEGRLGADLISYADYIKDQDILIYTLGFFENLWDDEKASAQALMQGIASDGCHYEVASAEDLVFFFEDMADQINGQKYIYIRIACPVDVFVSYHGETLNSSEKHPNLRTDFGVLTFEDSEEDSPEENDDRIKVLRLKEGVDYDVQIIGTGRGIMDYTIGFMDEEGVYSDLRQFNHVRITRKTVIDTVAAVSDQTILNVDEDGDGRYDIRYLAEENGYGMEMKNQWVRYIVVLGSVPLIILIFIIVLKSRKNKKRKDRKNG